MRAPFKTEWTPFKIEWAHVSNCTNACLFYNCNPHKLLKMSILKIACKKVQLKIAHKNVLLKTAHKNLLLKIACKNVRPQNCVTAFARIQALAKLWGHMMFKGVLTYILYQYYEANIHNTDVQC